MAVVLIGSTNRYLGLSTDTKPEAPAGSTFFETDTNNLYVYDGSVWCLANPNIQLAGGIKSGDLYIFTHELPVYPPPAHLATFGSVTVPAGDVLMVVEIVFGGVRTIDHSVSNAYTFSIDGALSLELYSGVYSGCLNLGSPYRMIFNAKGGPNNTTIINFVRGLPLLGGQDGSTYYWKMKNEDPMYAMTANVTILSQWIRG